MTTHSLLPLPPALMLLLSVSAPAQQTELFQLLPPQLNGIAEGRFGVTLECSDGWLVVTDPTASDTIGVQDFQGALYFYRRSGVSWQLRQHEVAGLAERFGSRTALDGPTLAVSSIGWDATADVNDDTGKVSIYELQNGRWILSQELFPVPAPCTTQTAFGWTLGLSGNVLAVGMRDCSAPQYFRQVRVYEKLGGAWTQVGIFRRPGISSTGSIGGSPVQRALAVDGDIVVAGASNQDEGAVVIRRESPGTWYRSAWLRDASAVSGDGLGDTVAIDGNTIVLGAPIVNGGPNGFHEGGYAVVFERTGIDRWTKVQRLEPSDPFESSDVGGRFGACVAIDGDEIVVGASDAGTAGFRTGTVYYFKKSASGWPRTETERFVASDAVRGDDLGSVVALEDGVVVATAADLGALGGLGRRVLEFRRKFGDAFCDAQLNSGRLTLHGTDVASEDATEFFVAGLRPGSMGGLAFSLVRTMGRPVFSGNLCLGPAVRLVSSVLQADDEGRVFSSINMNSISSHWSPGNTVRFQYWFEESAGQGVGLSNATELVLR